MANYFDGDIVRRDMEIELTDDLLSRARRERDGLRSELDAARSTIVKLRDAIRGLLMVSLPGDISGQRHVDDAREALKATENLPISYPINASTKLET